MKYLYFLKQTKIQILLIVILTTLVYLNIFQNGFVIDDKSFVVDWEAKRSLLNIGEFFQGAVPAGQEGVYRPVRSIFYAIYYQIGGTNVFIYHLHSLLVHLVSTVLIFFIVSQIVSKVNGENSIKYQVSSIKGKNKDTHNTYPLILIPFLVALLFGIHPIHTETITYISSAMEAVGLTFFLAAFYFYLREKNRVSWVFAGLAFFTTEFTLTLPLIILLYDFCFKKLTFKNERSSRLCAWTKRWKLYLPYFLLAGIYVFIRFFILQVGSRGPYLADSIYLTFLTMLKVFVKYISLVLLPLNQANNHTISGGIEAFVYRGYNHDPIKAQSLFNFDIMLSLVFLIGIFVAAIASFKKNPLITFAIGWFFITLLPVSEIVPQGSVLNEKSLYLPSFGIILLIVLLLQRLFKSQSQLLVAVLIISSIYGIITYSRNADWNNETSLWSKDIEAYPATNAYAYFQLGNANLEQNNFDTAIKNYQKAFEINKYFSVALASEARVYEAAEKNDLAIAQYKKVIETDPSFWEAYRNLANIYISKGENNQAREVFEQMKAIFPEYAEEALKDIKIEDL